MRALEDIRTDWARLDELYMTGRLDVMWNFARDIPDLLAEIERLKSDLAQSQAALTKLSREMWKDC